MSHLEIAKVTRLLPVAMEPLCARTPDGWADQALAEFDRFLQDHASCERKAAAQAMAILAKYPEHTILVEPLVALAREELEHFSAVCRILVKRGLQPLHDDRDPYVFELRKAMRQPREERLLDRLVVCGLIEARSHERLCLVADAIQDPELATFYAQLARTEAGHFKVFMRLAEQIYGEAEAARALNRLAKHEATVMLSVPARAAVH